MTRRWPRAAFAALLVAVALPSCSMLPGGGGGYELVAYFDRAVALYPHGDVNVMGVGIGTVDAVEIEDTRIRVEMTINDGVPLPESVNASIAPLTLVGERNVVLHPAWRPEMGDDLADDGDEIPMERTTIPVEPDEALEAFNDLAEALDPDAVAELVSSGAAALEGQGRTINEALGETSTLAATLAGLDTQLLDAAANLHALAGSLNSREQQLGSLIDGLSEATSVLAAERDGIAGFLRSIVSLTEQGNGLLDAYEDDLPGDIATLTDLILVLEANLGSVEQLVAAFPANNESLIAAYDPSRQGIVLRVGLTGVAIDLINALTGVLGLPPICIPGPGTVCP